MKTLVVFFTLSGNTRDIAHTIADDLDAEIEEITPVKPYPKVDPTKINWPLIKLSIGAIFQRHPKINPVKHSIKDFDLIVICSPIWANNLAPPLNTYINDMQSFMHKNVSVVFASNRKYVNEQAFHNARYKINAREGIIITETLIPVIGVEKAIYISDAKELSSQLLSFKNIKKQPQPTEVS